MAKKTICGIVVYCSDPRVENANLWKPIKQLLIPEEERLAPIGMFGAPVALARPADFPIKFAAIIEDMEFALEEFAEGKIVIVGHDCGIYKRLAKRVFAPIKVVSLQEKMDDLAIGARNMRLRFPGVPVEAHFKKAGPGFEQIA